MFLQDDDNPWASPPDSEPPKSTRENATKRENRGGPYNHQNGGRVEDFVSRFQDRLKNGGGGGGRNPTPQASPFLFVLIGIVGFVFWAASGLFRVQEGELGVVLRFGEMVHIVQPGLRYRLPYPFEQEIVRKVSVLNKIDGGVKDSKGGENADQNLVLTVDENMVQTSYTVLWKTRDLSEFLFTARDPEATIRVAAESVIREIIGQTTARLALTEGRETIGMQAQELLQKILDTYKLGVQIVSVQLQRVEPPSQVITTYNDMQASVIDEVRFLREAEAYENDKVPRARGDAQRIIQEAEGYKRQVVLSVEGEASKFAAVLQSYKLNPDVTRQRLYFDTMQSILSKMNKTIVDGKVGQGVMPYYNLATMTKAAPSKAEVK